MNELHDLAVNLSVASARLVRLTTQLSPTPFPRARWRMLAVLEERGAARVTELAQLDHIAQPTATEIVRGMRDDGLVSTRPDPRDARASLVELTQSGRDLLARLRREVGAGLEERLRGLDPADRDVLARAAVLMGQIASGM